MERSFASEIDKLKLGAGETFRGEAIVAVTKALLQSGVAYVGGYQGAPVSHLLDVMVSARDYLGELGVHVEACANEAAAAAMLAASINYPVRGAVTWKSIVGSNVASDALSNLASAGVQGGALIVVGEDYGDGASVIQERTYAVALKSTIWLIDPKPDLPTIVDMVEHGFALSEASHAPAFLQLRIRTCHLQGEYIAKDNVAPPVSARHRLAEPAGFLYDRLSHPPVTFGQEQDKRAMRIPAARDYIRRHRLNEHVKGTFGAVGLILQGGLYNTLIRQLAMAGLADAYGKPALDLLVLNVTYPLVPDEIESFCRDKDAVLVLEEGYPEFIEQQILHILVRAGIATDVRGKDLFEGAGEYTGEWVARGLAGFLEAHGPAAAAKDMRALADGIETSQEAGRAAFDGAAPPPREPTFCTGCPERPVFGALKLVEREVGPVHVAADIGCHAFATFAPFSMGNSILGYGMSLASTAAVGPIQQRRTLAVMGDGGFWHNGLQSGVAGTLFNRGDGVLVIMQNGYASATGQQAIPSSGEVPAMAIEPTLRALGVTWLRTVRTYAVETMVRTLREAFTTAQEGLKVIIADGECMLARRRREKVDEAKNIAAGARVETARFGIDPDLCTGDHACIRLSGCPSLTVAANPDPLRDRPVSHVTQDCVACGLCGEMAHAAALCPSFYRATRIHNPGLIDRLMHRLRGAVIGWLARRV
ncbi:MAG: indolepyruvate ferredoxin oxidoreductase subunit alpha [Rhodospirillales bacterium]|nr:MAG: indolepyruvate ferredoxin oxidoreductase subunit alpha [Rhodospirillales bacterium]